MNNTAIETTINFKNELVTSNFNKRFLPAGSSLPLHRRCFGHQYLASY